MTFARLSSATKWSAAMRRMAQGQEFRSNVHRGAVAEPVELDDRYHRDGRKSRSDHGTPRGGCGHAGEPGWASGHGGQLVAWAGGYRDGHELDIAGAVVDYIAAQVDFPELDVRQRLTVSRGYGVAELQFREGSEYVGKTIAERHFASRTSTC